MCSAVQAFVSFVGDCPDVGMLEDVLTALNDALQRGSPTHLPLVACLRAHGGERLFMSLLQREQQTLRLLGLQLLTAFLGPADANAARPGGDATAEPPFSPGWQPSTGSAGHRFCPNLTRNRIITVWRMPNPSTV